MPKQKYSKKYYEGYAKCNLFINYCSDYKKLRKKESPDFQNEKLDVGIEVTRAISTEDGQALNTINEYFGKNLSGKFIKNEINAKYYGKFKYKIETFDDDTAYYREDYNKENKKNEIEIAIKSKLNKLNNKYKIFKTNCLYVFGGTCLIEKDILESVMTDIQKINLKNKFDIIFVNAVDMLYIMNFNENSIKEIEINELDNIKCIRYAEKNNK